MLLAKRVLLPTRVLLAHRHSATSTINSRLASTQADDNHRDGGEYPREGFSSPFWRNVGIVSVLAYVAYRYTPEPSDDAYLTRWIAMYTPPRDVWLERNARHTAQQQDVSETNLLLAEARKPPVHRMRYPQIFELRSPFLNPVGMEVKLDSVVVKGDKDP